MLNTYLHYTNILDISSLFLSFYFDSNRPKGFDEKEIENIVTSPTFQAYDVSKIGLSALTRIQQRHFAKDLRPGIIVNSVHPGFVSTDMTKHFGGINIEEGLIQLFSVRL